MNVKKYSTSRFGITSETVEMLDENIVIQVRKQTSQSVIKHYEKTGLFTHVKTIKYKRPFYKFKAFKDCLLIVFKINLNKQL